MLNVFRQLDLFHYLVIENRPHCTDNCNSTTHIPRVLEEGKLAWKSRMADSFTGRSTYMGVVRTCENARRMGEVKELCCYGSYSSTNDKLNSPVITLGDMRKIVW